jgi:hypothetical protein
MTKNEVMRALRKVLADLYPKQEDAEVVVIDAGLNPSFIPFSTKSINNWYSILQEAEKRNLVGAILQVVNEMYGDSLTFQQVYQAYWEVSGEPVPHPGAGSAAPVAEPAATVRQIKILFLAANPVDTAPLRLDEEIRAIDQALRQAIFRDRFDLHSHWAVRYRDLQELLLRYQPDIVHFSGHGSDTREIILQDDAGASYPVSERALSTLFAILKDNIRCVVLNACYSESQAGAIAQSIDAVVGMSDSIGDRAAIDFAVAFYQALGFGRTLKTAFDLGCLQIDPGNLEAQEAPKLLAPNSDPAQIVLIDSESR